MESDWNEVDEDLEMLLKFDDLDRLFVPNSGNKMLPSNSPCISAVPVGRPVTTIDVMVADGNFSSQAHASLQQQAKLSSEILGSEFNLCPVVQLSRDDEDCTRPAPGCSKRKGLECLTTRRKESRGHDVAALLGKTELASSGAGNDSLRRCEDAVTSNVNRDLPDGKFDSEEVEGHSREQNGPVLSGVVKDKGELEANVGCQSSQPTRVQAGKRYCQDRNTEATRLQHGSVHADDVTRGRMQSPVGEEINEDEDDHLVFDKQIPHQGRNCFSRRETSLSPSILGYRIPGPAGALQKCFSQIDQNAQGATSERSLRGNRYNGRATLSADADFREGPWLAAMEFLNDRDSSIGKQRPRSTLATIKATNLHITQLVLLIKTVTPNGFGDVSVTLKDPTGVIHGNIHRTVLTELEAGQLIAPGAVVVLQKVAIFSPTPCSHYLNININNVEQIFDKDANPSTKVNVAVGSPRSNLRSNATTGTGNLSLSHGPFFSEPHPTAKEGYESGRVDLKFDNSEREVNMETDHIKDSIERPKSASIESPGSAKEPRKIASRSGDVRTQCRIAADGNVELRDANVTLPDFQARAKVSQEDVAKEAGWDFSEDIELLLDDGFPVLQ